MSPDFYKVWVVWAGVEPGSPRGVGVNQTAQLTGIGMPKGGIIGNWDTTDYSMAVVDESGVVSGLAVGSVGVWFDYTYSVDGFTRSIQSELWNMDVAELEIVEPVANRRFDITAEPRMPDINARAEINGLMPDPTPNTNFTWELRISYTGPDGRQVNYDYPVQQIIGGNFTPVFNVMRGGDLEIGTSANIGGSVIQGITQGLIIRGVNPTNTEVNNALPDDTSRRIACWESGRTLDQFGGGGLPMFGGPHGYGIMQIDNPPASDEAIWNWRENIQEGLNILNQKRADAARHHIGERRLINLWRAARGLPLCPQGVPPPLDAQQQEIEAIRRYNGGREHQWFAPAPVGTPCNARSYPIDAQCTGEWVRCPDTAGDPLYVDWVLGAQCP